jgi:hypothetical protein
MGCEMKLRYHHLKLPPRDLQAGAECYMSKLRDQQWFLERFAAPYTVEDPMGRSPHKVSRSSFFMNDEPLSWWFNEGSHFIWAMRLDDFGLEIYKLCGGMVGGCPTRK